MKGSWCSCSLWGGLRGGALAAALCSLLAGCSLTNDVFGGGSNDQPTSTPQPVAGPAANTTPSQGASSSSGQTYPNINSVPQQAPATSSADQRQQVASGLIADNQNAAYSDQPVTAQQTGTPVAPPVPAPAPAPAASSGTDTGAVSTATIPAPAPAPQPTVAQTVTNQPAQTANAPSATVVPLPEAPATTTTTMTPPATTSGATPMAPPPNPVPPAPTAMASTSGVTVDTSQLGGSPLPGYQPAPNYSTLSGPLATGVPGGAPAYALPAGAAPVAGQPVAVIYFNDASSAVSDRGQWVLRNVAMLQQQLGGRLRVVGNASLHTVPMDQQRHDQVNYRMSQARANSVAQALIGMGVPQGSIGVSAQGSQAPIFYEFMPTGEAANRRVDIYLDR